MVNKRKVSKMTYKCKQLNGYVRSVNLKKMNLVAVNYKGGYISVDPNNLYSIVQHRTDYYIDDSKLTLRYFAASGVGTSDSPDYSYVSEMSEDDAKYSIAQCALSYMSDNGCVLYLPDGDTFTTEKYEDGLEFDNDQEFNNYVYKHILASIA